MGIVMLLAAVAVFLIVRGWLAQGFSDGRALEYAKLAGAAYCSREDLAKWNCGLKCSADVSSLQYCEGYSTNAYVALWERRCLVSFMGTKEYSAMLTDLEFLKSSVEWDVCQGCRVHGGFLSEWQSLEPCIKQRLVDLGCPRGSNIRVTGHSLGAALSALAMMSLHGDGWRMEEAYNFGMPRTGDVPFAVKFNNLFKGRFFRVTHHQDPIPQLPPSSLIVDWQFQHVEPEIFYDGAVAAGHKLCEADGDTRCSGQYAALADVMKDMLLHVNDHMNYMGIQIGSAGCPNGGSMGVVQATGTISANATDALGMNASMLV